MLWLKIGEFVVPVAREYINNESQGFQSAHVTTAVALTPELRTSVEELVKKISGKKPLLKASGKKYCWGLYLTMDDSQIDQSVKGALNKLKVIFDQKSKKS